MGRKKKDAENVSLADHLRSIASSGGKARAESLSEEQLKAAGRAGGAARAANMSPAQRKKAAQAAAAARWGKAKETKKP